MIEVKNKGGDNFMVNFVLPAQSPKVVCIFLVRMQIISSPTFNKKHFPKILSQHPTFMR
jgi:hypothetical protein